MGAIAFIDSGSTFSYILAIDDGRLIAARSTCNGKLPKTALISEVSINRY